MATAGLASTASAQIGERFDALKATEIRVVDARHDGTDPFPTDTDQRLARLNGVRAAGIFWTINKPGLDPRALPSRVGRQASDPIPVMAASPGALLASVPTVKTGRLYDVLLARRGERVAVLGRVAAAQLGITRTDDSPAIFIGDIGYVVIGIIDDVKRNPDLLISIMIPPDAARRDLPLTGDENYAALIDVAPGAAQLIGRQAPIALRPDQPDLLQSLVPPDPRSFRQGIEGDVTNLFYALAALALLIGLIGITNTTLVAVLERQHEIAIRRALGARRRHIALQILTESALLGLLGAIAGVAMALVAVSAISISKDWTTTIDPLIPLFAPTIGVAAGLLAGLQPALRATRGDIAANLR